MNIVFQSIKIDLERLSFTQLGNPISFIFGSALVSFTTVRFLDNFARKLSPFGYIGCFLGCGASSSYSSFCPVFFSFWGAVLAHPCF